MEKGYWVATPPKLQKEKAGENKELPTVGDDQVQAPRKNVKVQKYMGPEKTSPGVLRELVEVVAKPLSIICEKLWQSGEAPTVQKRVNITPIFKKRKKED